MPKTTVTESKDPPYKVIETVPDARDWRAEAAAFALRGHQIITDGLARARQTAGASPHAPAAVTHMVEETMHALWAHLLAGPHPQELPPPPPDPNSADCDQKAAAPQRTKPPRTDKVSHMATDPNQKGS